MSQLNIDAELASARATYEKVIQKSLRRYPDLVREQMLSFDEWLEEME